MKRSVIIGVCSVMVMISALDCGRQAAGPPVVARVGDRVIDVNQLQRSFEFQPQWRKGMTKEEAYGRQLEYLVIQKLYALKASSTGMHNDSLLAGYLSFVRDKELIKALYKKEIKDHVQITDAEYRDGYRWLKRTVTFEFIFTRDSARCAHYAEQLTHDSAGAITLVDPFAEIKGVRKDVRYGELAVELERPLFDGRPGDVVPPFRVRDGYMAVRFVNGTIDKFQSEQDFAEHKTRIAAIIGGRRADSLAAEYISRIMRDKELTLRPETFWPLAGILARRVGEPKADPFGMPPVAVSNQEIQQLEGDVTSIAGNVLVTYRDGSLTVGEFLASVADMPAGMRPNLRTPQDLKDAVAIIVRNRYLAKAAREQGLAGDVQVQRNIEMETDEALARFWVLRQLEQIPVTESDLAAARAAGMAAPDAATLADDVRRKKLQESSIGLISSLKKEFPTTVDSTIFRTVVTQPKEVIAQNPVRMVVRELFQ